MSAVYAIDDRLDFLEVDHATRSILKEFSPTLVHELPGILAAFYGHIQRFPSLAAMFHGRDAMDRASRAQGEHWLKLFSGRFDDDYVASVRRIGQMHSRIGLEPRWYLGAYTFILGRVYGVACHTYGSRLHPAAAQARTAALMRALNRAVMLDMDLAISIYLDENKLAYDHKLAALADAFGSKVEPLVGSVSTQAYLLGDTARVMSGAAEETSRQATIVASAAEEASVNVQTVATAGEELHASVLEISRQVTHSTRITNAAVEAAERTNGTVQGLMDAAQKIGDVVKLISDIASQTNLPPA